MIDKQLIIDRAAEMFTQEGVKAIRMDDIAASLSISKRTMYELIGDKETLIRLSVECHFEKDRDFFEDQTAKVDNILDEIFMYHTTFSERMHHNYILMEGLKKFHPKIYENIEKERIKLVKEYLTLKINKGKADGIFIDETNTELTVFLFMNAILNLGRDIALPSGCTIHDAFEYNALLLFRGLSSEKGLNIIDKYIKRK